MPVAQTPKGRLNPFCLPSDTSCRFALLVVTVLGANLFIYDALFIHRLNVSAYLGCLALEPSAAEIAGNLRNPLGDPSALVAKSTAFSKCVMQAQRVCAYWMLGGVSTLAIVTLVIVWLLPVIKVRQGHLQRLSPDDAREVLASLENLSEETGLQKQPQFLWNPLNPACTGLAFGRPGHSCVALAGGLVTRFYTDPAAFRAVMRHELAHIRNADISKTYFAVASWYAFLLVALAPFFLSMDLNFLTTQIWPVLFLAVLVYLSRSAVLRIREIYADVRASQWDSERALERVIAALPPVKDSFWRRLWRVHPTSIERCNSLNNTQNLFESGFWETLAAGLATGIAFPNFQLLLQTLIVGSIQVGILASGVFAILIAGIVGTRIWRSSLAALVGVAPPPNTWRLGLALSLGLVLGLRFSFSAVFNGPVDQKLVTFLWDGLLIIALIASSVLFVRWEMISASAWLGSTATTRSPLGIYLAAQVISAMFLAVIFGSLCVAWQVGQAYLSAGLPGFARLLLSGVFVVLNQPSVTLLLVVLWAFPLAAWFWRSSAGARAASWVFLDSPVVPVALPRQESFQPKLAFCMGVVGGVVFSVLHFVIHLAWHFSLHGTPASNPARLRMFFSQILLGALVQTAAAALTATRVRSLPLLHGLLGAFTAASIMGAAFLTMNLGFGGSVDLKFAATVLLSFINAGAFLSMAVIPIVVVVKRAGSSFNQPSTAVTNARRAAQSST